MNVAVEMHTPPRARAVASIPALGVPAATRRAVIVEDDEAVARLIALVLRSEGYESVHVTCPDVALALACVGNPDVVLVDLELPSMSGDAFLREVALLPRRPAVVIVSAASQAPEVAERHAVPLVRKPFKLATLTSTVAEAVSRATAIAAE